MSSACVTRLVQVLLALSIALGLPLHVAAAALWSVVLLFVPHSPSKRVKAPLSTPLESSAPGKGESHRPRLLVEEGSFSGSSHSDHCTLEFQGPLTLPVDDSGGKLPAQMPTDVRYHNRTASPMRIPRMLHAGGT